MARTEDGFFSAKDNLRLYWQSQWPDEVRAHVAVVHGYGDHVGRYHATVDALVADGFAVHGFDYRGHGRADGRRGYCGAWTEYLDDLESFWARVRRSAEGKKTFLLAHSHGALMAVHLLGRGGLEGMAGMVLSAPYFKLALTPPAFKFLAARVAGVAVPWLPIPTELTPASLTRDEAAQAAVRQDPLYNTIVTPRWFLESTKVQGEVLALASKAQGPLFVLVGEEDGVASGEMARAFYEAAVAQDKKFKAYPGMRHEPLNELGKEEVFRDISGWISAHL